MCAGIVNPSDAAMHVVKLGRGAGARYVEHCGVAELLSTLVWAWIGKRA